MSTLEKMLSNEECVQQKCLDFHLYSLDETNDQEEYLMIKKLFSKKSNKSKDFEKCFNNYRKLNGNPVFTSFTRSRKIEINEVGMWNTYNDRKEEGIAIVLNYLELKRLCKENKLEFKRCNYAYVSKIQGIAESLYKRWSEGEEEENKIFEELIIETICSKRMNWLIEDEYRIFGFITEKNTKKDKRAYYQLKIPIDLINKIIISPYADEHKITERIKGLFEEKNIKSPDIKTSKLNIKKHKN